MQTVGLVVNYDLPITAAVYLHRIGRSGRFGRRGLAISLMAGNDDSGALEKAHLANIAKAYSISIEPAPAKLDQLTNSEPAVAPTPITKTVSKPVKRTLECQSCEKIEQPQPETWSKSKKRKLRDKKKKKDKKRKKAKREAPSL